MPAWSSSSLGFSDHNTGRHKGSGLMKNLSERISKQHITEHKMFGSKRGKSGKDFKIGSKMFRKKGKGVLKSISSSKGGDLSSKGISPSVEEFDKMMNSVSGGKKSKVKNGKTMFSRKSFG